MLKVRSSSLDIKKYVIEQNLMRFEDIYQHLYDNIDKFAEGKQSGVILKIADGIKNDTMCANKQIMFIACIIEILKVLKSP